MTTKHEPQYSFAMTVVLQSSRFVLITERNIIGLQYPSSLKIVHRGLLSNMAKSQLTLCIILHKRLMMWTSWYGMYHFIATIGVTLRTVDLKFDSNMLRRCRKHKNEIVYRFEWRAKNYPSAITIKLFLHTHTHKHKYNTERIERAL
jgi:hypothetical protein